MRAFFHFLVLFASSRTSALFLFACIVSFSVLTLCSFSFEMVKQRTDFGSNDSGAVLCIPCLVQM